MFSKYRKFWVAAAGFAVVAGKVFADGHASTAEWGELAIALVTAIGVVSVPNAPAATAPQAGAHR
jgi:hypothetical protein